MKMIYSSPEMEVILLNVAQPVLLSASEREDITDGPVDVIDNPTDDDLDW